MRLPRDTTRLSIVGLVVLALLAVGLSVAALRQPGRVTATPAPAQSSTTVPPTASPATDSSPAQSSTPAPSSASSSATPSSTPVTPRTVVIVGDSYSLGASTQTWVGPVAEKLGWTTVVNLSSPGRGYLATPRQCDFVPCATFEGTIPKVVESQPDVVVTFGGFADGDFSITALTADYYRTLRASLPGTQIVALSPVTTEAGPAPYWLTLHSQSIRDGVEAVGGTFVDLGQPGLGNGEALSAEAHAAIAQRVIDRLSQG